MALLNWNGRKPAQEVKVNLPLSKSISNRLLILQSLSNSQLEIPNYSDANDTKLLAKILENDPTHIDVEDAGTVARFILSWACFQNKPRTIDGTSRMRERPIKPLVESLNQLGFSISYSGNEGCLPVKITPIDPTLVKQETQLDVSSSSQFASALCLIAPFLESGLKIKLMGDLVSKPYMEMTLQLIQDLGAPTRVENGSIYIKPIQLKKKTIKVESDWSSAAFWFEMVALMPQLRITLTGLSKNSLQGDAELIKLFQPLGVKAVEMKDGIQLTNSGDFLNEVFIDFNQTPDLAQAFITTCAALKIQGRFSGISTLTDKETDRVFALQTELKKIGYDLTLEGSDVLTGTPSGTNNSFEFQTYDDHRMAMCLAPLVFAFGEIHLDNPKCVSKSYPRFWEELNKLGVELK